MRLPDLAPHSSRPIRVAYILWDGTLGGAASNAIDLVRHSSRLELEVTVCLLNEKGDASMRMEQLGVRVEAFGARSGLDVRAAWRLVEFLRREQFDLVHNNSKTWFAHLAILVGAIGIARLYQEHGDIHTAGSEHSAGALYRLAPWTYDLYLTVSAETAAQMVRAGAPAARIRNVRNPVDLLRFDHTLSRTDARRRLGLSVDCVLIGTACRLVKQKDLPLFLEAASRIGDSRRDVAFVIAGEGAEEAALRKKADQLGVSGRVRFLGNCGDMPGFWRAIDLYLFTSHQESFGLTLVECLASGTPIVGVRPAMGGGAILDSAEGVVVIGSRSADDLARTTLDLLADGPRRVELGKRANRWASAQADLSVAHWVDRMLTTYRELLMPGSRAT